MRRFPRSAPVRPTQVARQILRRLVRGLLQTSNMTMEFHNPLAAVRTTEVAGFTARKFLKIFVAYLFCSATFPRP
jgi:hypothetical protein